MNKKFSLVAALSVLALVGAGCSTVSDDTVKSTSDDTVVSNGDTMEKTETTSVDENTTGEDTTTVVENTVTSVAYNVGDVVMVDLGYGWYEGKVEDFACEAGFYVRYRGLSASCITEDKLVKPVAPSAESLVVGAKVIANIDKGEMFGGKEIFPYYSGEITAVNASTYTVKDNSKKEREITIDKIYLK
ncbi:MAG: hypothetical protein A2493_02910 [Candidatus Magasanikbacteria bacterium RIFOXYC12_FULL_33_11]|uniref:Uncharacterized protein n=1 Tax=Candidatus Magasanikbacteria bacterium RIFOXYC12_FULL_33_11 TaxID=1798701 RepID=A0A1F6NS20_9BACT|nr:MAG: hypothetical protein A2493_02910 [Candidatus Magasanikbacteria bacterium RIFOXYC12_FULL_33_11]